MMDTAMSGAFMPAARQRIRTTLKDGVRGLVSESLDSDAPMRGHMGHVAGSFAGAAAGADRSASLELSMLGQMKADFEKVSPFLPGVGKKIERVHQLGVTTHDVESKPERSGRVFNEVLWAAYNERYAIPSGRSDTPEHDSYDAAFQEWRAPIVAGFDHHYKSEVSK